MKHFVLIIFLFVVAQTSRSQECSRILVIGKVVDTLRPQAFYNLMVINRTTGRGVFGQPNGAFSVYVSPGDSISLSCKGYPMINF